MGRMAHKSNKQLNTKLLFFWCFFFILYRAVVMEAWESKFSIVKIQMTSSIYIFFSFVSFFTLGLRGTGDLVCNSWWPIKTCMHMPNFPPTTPSLFKILISYQDWGSWSNTTLGGYPRNPQLIFATWIFSDGGIRKVVVDHLPDTLTEKQPKKYVQNMSKVAFFISIFGQKSTFWKLGYIFIWEASWLPKTQLLLRRSNKITTFPVIFSATAKKTKRGTYCIK